MERITHTNVFVAVFSIAIACISTILIILGELRIDVYISLYILAYYILRALYSPFPRDVDRRLRIIDIGFFLVFSVIVGYRVLLIIAPEVLMQWFPGL